MSIQAVAAVFQLDLPPLSKWVLVCLADNADSFGGNIFPTITTLSQKSGIPERTLQRHLRALVESKVLEVVRAAQRPTKDKRGRGTEYRLSFMTNPIASAPRPNYQSCPPKLRIEVIEAYQETCSYCGRKGNAKDPDGRSWHIDRIIPGSRGGGYSPENITLSCATCNISKGAGMAPVPVPDLGAKRIEMGAKELDTGARRPSTGAAAMAPDPSIEPLEEPPVEPSMRVFGFWKEHLAHPRAHFDDKRRKAVSARLRDGYSADDLILAVRGCRLSPHNMGDNDRQEIYDDLELICRDTSHVERFIARAEVGTNGNGNGRPKTQSERNVANIQSAMDIIRSRTRQDNSQEPTSGSIATTLQRRV